MLIKYKYWIRKCLPIIIASLPTSASINKNTIHNSSISSRGQDSGENPKGNKEVWESRERSTRKTTRDSSVTPDPTDDRRFQI